MTVSVSTQACRLAAYCDALDEALLSLNDALAKVGLLNDQMYDEEEIMQRAPAADVWLVRETARKLQSELDCFYGTRDPGLPTTGEVLYQQLLRDAALR